MSFLTPIPLHKTALFRFEDVPYGNNCKYIKSYYHHLTDFLPYHTHDFYEINIVYSGVGIHQLEKREILTQCGDVFIIPPHRQHGYACHADLTVYHILLSNAFIDRFLPFLEKMPGYNMIFHIEPMFREHFEKPYYLKAEDIPFAQLQHHIALIDACKEDGDESAAVAHVLSLIATLSSAIYSLRPINTDTLPNEHMLTVLESMEYIEKHFDSKIDFKEIARKSAHSYSTYLRYFKTLSGTTPSKYQTQCKIKKAASMLLNTNESILSIGLTCGFYDSSHFIREFMKEKHLSPADFRKAQTRDPHCEIF